MKSNWNFKLLEKSSIPKHCCLAWECESTSTRRPYKVRETKVSFFVAVVVVVYVIISFLQVPTFRQMNDDDEYFAF